MLPNYSAAVSALAYSLLRQRCETASRRDGFPHNEVARFVLEQQRRMPDYLRAALWLLTLFFDLLPITWRGRPFHGLPPEWRQQYIEMWRGSMFGPARDLIKFYESLVVYGWFAAIHDPR